MSGTAKTRPTLVQLAYPYIVFSDKASPPTFRVSSSTSMSRISTCGLDSSSCRSPIKASVSTSRTWSRAQEVAQVPEPIPLQKSKMVTLVSLQMLSSARAVDPQRRSSRDLCTSRLRKVKPRRRWKIFSRQSALSLTTRTRM